MVRGSKSWGDFGGIIIIPDYAPVERALILGLSLRFSRSGFLQFQRTGLCCWGLWFRWGDLGSRWFRVCAARRLNRPFLHS